MKKGFKSNRNKGQTLIIAVLLFSAAATTLVLGVVAPLIREIQIIRDLESSKKSYFTAEGGLEDVVYRLKTDLGVSSSEEVNLSGSTATAITTDVGEGKRVVSTGSAQGDVRKAEASLIWVGSEEEGGYEFFDWREVQ